MAQRNIAAAITSLERDGLAGREEVVARFARFNGRRLCDALLARLEIHGVTKKMWWIAQALTSRGEEFLDLNRARRISQDSRLGVLARAVALEALDASNVFSGRPSPGSREEVWLHWAAACYHRRMGAGHQALAAGFPTHEKELARLRLVPVVLATEHGWLKQRVAGQQFVRDFFKLPPGIREDVWTDFESCRKGVGVTAESAYAAVGRPQLALLGARIQATLAATIKRETRLRSDRHQK